MPTEAEIRTRAMQEFQMALEVGEIRREAILEARAEALNAVPAAAAALGVYDQATAAAEAACLVDHDAARDACQVA